MKPGYIIKQAVDRTRRANDLDERIYRSAQEALKNCLIIPKPKFKVGDVVTRKRAEYIITEVYYNYTKEIWEYSNGEYGISWRMKEDELELVEVRRDH